MLKERPFAFPLDKSIRVICDTDCYNECDDQYCVAHMLMTPRFDVKAVIAEQFGTVMPKEGTEQESYDEIVHITSLMGIRDEVNILHGAPTALKDDKTPIDSEGARFIIEEAMKDDPRPLFVCNLGAITNLASAYLMEPAIAKRMTVIWIGGNYPDGGFEFNQNNDLNAARVVIQSDMELWQVPSSVYTTMKVSFFELLNKVYPCGELGRYLVENTMRFSGQMAQMMKAMSEMKMEGGESPATSMFGVQSPASMATCFGGEQWSLGDSPTVGLMINNTCGRFDVIDAPCDIRPDSSYDYSRPGSRKIRVYKDIDSHFILNDMFEKLKYYFG